jgi:hypothetical protein
VLPLFSSKCSETLQKHIFVIFPVHRSYWLGQGALVASSSPLGRNDRLSSKHFLSLLTSVLKFEAGISSKMPAILITVAWRKNKRTALPEWQQLWKLKVTSTLNCWRRILIQVAESVITVAVMTSVVSGIAQSVLPLATGRTVRRSNPGESEFFCARPDRPCGQPRLLYNGYRG